MRKDAQICLRLTKLQKEKILAKASQVNMNITDYMVNAGTKRKITVHGLRHNFATDLIENGLDILHLQKLLGHSGIRSTMEYLHLANVEKDIISPLDRLYRSCDENA